MTNTTERHNLRTAHDAIARRVDFKCNGTLEGILGASRGMGRLPEHWHARFLTAMDASDRYFVYSYNTPIAWFANGQWFVPEVKYSVTTSRHQTTVKRGINL